MKMNNLGFPFNFEDTYGQGERLLFFKDISS